MSIAGMIMVSISYLLAPIVVLFATKEGWLPSWLNWFQTPDNSLDGDGGWRSEHFLWLRWVYARRVLWLWRNPTYGFDVSVLGYKVPYAMMPEIIGDNLVSNIPLHEGKVLRLYKECDKVSCFQFYLIKTYNFFGLRCIRLHFGWKIWGAGVPGDIKQIVCSINPWMKVR